MLKENFEKTKKIMAQLERIEEYMTDKYDDGEGKMIHLTGLDVFINNLDEKKEKEFFELIENFSSKYEEELKKL